MVFIFERSRDLEERLHLENCILETREKSRKNLSERKGRRTLDFAERKIKQERAYGECLGVRSRRRTW